MLVENLMSTAFSKFDNDTSSLKEPRNRHEGFGVASWPLDAWKAPIGFVNSNSKNDTPSLKPDPDRAPLVLEAFQDGRARSAAGRHR